MLVRKTPPEKWIFIKPFLWWWWQYCSTQGDGSPFPYGLTGLGWFPLQGPLHPRWWNMSKFRDPHSPDGITLPKCACNWENGQGLALSCGPCVDVCVHFQVVFELLQGGWMDGGICFICIYGELLEAPRPESCDWSLLQRVKRAKVFKHKRGKRVTKLSQFMVPFLSQLTSMIFISMYMHARAYMHTHTHTWCSIY